jgi:hypothetical protein
MLTAGNMPHCGPEKRSQGSQHRIEYRDARDAQGTALFLQHVPEPVVDQGKEDQAGVGGDPVHDLLQLPFRAHHGPSVLDRLHVLELHQTGARHGIDGFAGGVRDEMQMKELHERSAGLWTASQ